MYRYHVDILHEHKVRCTQGAPVSASAEDATDLNLQRVGVVVSGQTMQECQDGVTLVTHDICACKAPGGQVAFQGTRTKSPPGLGLASARVGTCTGGAWCPFGRSRHKACGWGRCFGEGANAYNPPTGPVTWPADCPGRSSGGRWCGDLPPPALPTDWRTNPGGRGGGWPKGWKSAWMMPWWSKKTFITNCA